MRIVCLSDTHTYGERIKVPDGDVLIHAGDHTFRGTYSETRAALKWMDSLPHEHKVIIGGNHDFYFDESFPSGHQFRGWVIDRKVPVADLLAEFPSLTYLQDSGAEIAGLKFWGSPWQPWYHDWAFQFPILNADSLDWRYPQPIHDREVAEQTWAKIPDDTQVLVTHTPPQGILDNAYDASKQGCPELRTRVDDLHALRLHVFGHIHEGYGRKDYELAATPDGPFSSVTFVNASINTLDYDPTNQPIVVDL